MGICFLRQFPLGDPDRFQNRSDFDPVLPAAIEDAFQIGFGGHGRRFLIRAVHGVGHNLQLLTVSTGHGDGRLAVQIGKTLVMVQTPFIPFGDPL